jgi:hypothetical protein
MDNYKTLKEISEDQPFILNGKGFRWEYKRYTCTKTMPYSKDYTGKWSHPDSKHVRDDYGSLASGGSYEHRKCPNCGLSFRIQLPD